MYDHLLIVIVHPLVLPRSHVFHGGASGTDS